MCFMTMKKIWELPVKGTPKFVLLCLADFARRQKEGEIACWPTVETIAKRCGCSVTTVFRALKKLEELGYIERQHPRPGGPTRYVLKIDDGDQDQKEETSSNPQQVAQAAQAEADATATAKAEKAEARLEKAEAEADTLERLLAGLTEEQRQAVIEELNQRWEELRNPVAYAAKLAEKARAGELIAGHIAEAAARALERLRERVLKSEARIARAQETNMLQMPQAWKELGDLRKLVKETFEGFDFSAGEKQAVIEAVRQRFEDGDLGLSDVPSALRREAESRYRSISSETTEPA